MQDLRECYQDIISPDNMWAAWRLFRRGKQHRHDVQLFNRHLETNLLTLRQELLSEKYGHGGYRTRLVFDPKRREINIPAIRDQVVHQMIWNVLFPFYNRRFSSAATSCRPGMGTSHAIERIMRTAKRLGQQGKVFVLYIDIKKFFDSVPHNILLETLAATILCPRTVELLRKIIASYYSSNYREAKSPGGG